MKIFNKMLLGGALLSALLIGTSTPAYAFPTREELAAKNYKFQATKTIGSSDYQSDFDLLPDEFEFNFINGEYTFQVEGFLNSQYALTATYTEGTGSLQIMTTNFAATGISTRLETKVDGSIKSLDCTVNDDGTTITFPEEFSVCYYTNNNLVATYSNITCAEEVDPNAPTHPSKEELVAMEFEFNGTLSQGEYYSDFSEYYDALSTTYPISFSSSTGNYVYIEGLCGMTGTTYGILANYDASKGTLTMSNGTGKYINNNTSYKVYFVDGSYGTTGVQDSHAPVWTVNTVDGVTTIECPDFNIREYNDDQCFALYSEITIGAPNPQGWLNPDISNTTSLGTYDWEVLETNMQASKEGTPTSIQVNVLQDNSDETIIYLQEAEGTDLFGGYIVTATFNSSTGKLSVEQKYAGVQDGDYIWFSPWNYNPAPMTEPQSSIVISFNKNTGFSFEPTYKPGFGWFVSEEETEFYPSSLYQGFYLPIDAPEITISNAEATVNDNNVTVTVDAELINITASQIGSIEGIFTPTTGDNVTAAGTYSNGTITFELEDVAAGSYSYTLDVTLYDASEGEIAVSDDAVPVTFTVTFTETPQPEITISNAEVDVTEEEVTITFDVELSDIDLDETTFEAQLSLEDGDETVIDVEIEEGTVTIVLTGLEPDTEYNYSIVLVGYVDDAEIATSNALEVTVKDIPTGVDSINAENGNVRYFNLQGVEVANPDKGIYIRVSGDKAVKVVR